MPHSHLELVPEKMAVSVISKETKTAIIINYL